MTPRLFLVLLAGLVLASCAEGYTGFDCGQGSAILQLASHKCPSDVHQQYLSCFRSLALRIKHCGVKAWPHPHQGRKHGCGSLQLVANVTDVNHAHGTLHLHGSTKDRAVPVHLEYSRPDESMHLRLSTPGGQQDSCVLVFDAQAASDASLHPVPGEDTRSMATLLAMLVPTILVPCVVVGLVVSLGRVARARSHASWHSEPSSGAAEGYTLLDAGPSSSSSAGQPLAEGAIVSSLSNSRTAMGLGILKAMSRRARAKRMRRSCRPAYVGLPEQSVQQHRAYVAGRLQPGPFHLVAPFFKFPPIACPPPLDAIPESVTPTSSTQDLSGVSDPSRESDSAADTPTSGSSGGFSAQSQHQQPLLEVGGGFNLPSAWIAPACGDAEEGGAASS